ncbi:hypothetical protein V8E36_006789 [Tilletia maclaganii]
MSNLLHSTRSAKLMALAKTCVDKKFSIPNTHDGSATLTLRQHLVHILVSISSTIKEATALLRSTAPLALDDVSVLTSSSTTSISLVARVAEYNATLVHLQEVHESGQSKLAALREQILEQLYARTTPACAHEHECVAQGEEAVFADPMSDPRTPRNLKTFACRQDARFQARDCSRGERQSPVFCRLVKDEDEHHDGEADAEHATADAEQASPFPTPGGHNLADCSTALPTATTPSANHDSYKTQALSQEAQSRLSDASTPSEVHSAWANLSGWGTTNKDTMAAVLAWMSEPVSTAPNVDTISPHPTPKAAPDLGPQACARNPVVLPTSQQVQTNQAPSAVLVGATQTHEPAPQAGPANKSPLQEEFLTGGGVERAPAVRHLGTTLADVDGARVSLVALDSRPSPNDKNGVGAQASPGPRTAVGGYTVPIENAEGHDGYQVRSVRAQRLDIASPLARTASAEVYTPPSRRPSPSQAERHKYDSELDTHPLVSARLAVYRDEDDGMQQPVSDCRVKGFDQAHRRPIVYRDNDENDDHLARPTGSSSTTAPAEKVGLTLPLMYQDSSDDDDSPVNAAVLARRKLKENIAGPSKRIPLAEKDVNEWLPESRGARDREIKGPAVSDAFGHSALIRSTAADATREWAQRQAELDEIDNDLTPRAASAHGSARAVVPGRLPLAVLNASRTSPKMGQDAYCDFVGGPAALQPFEGTSRYWHACRQERTLPDHAASLAREERTLQPAPPPGMRSSRKRESHKERARTLRLPSLDLDIG